MNKKVIILAIILILLFPFKVNYLKDGGSKCVKSLTYELIKVHSLISEDEAEKLGLVKNYRHGYIIKILGFEIYNNVN